MREGIRGQQEAEVIRDKGQRDGDEGQQCEPQHDGRDAYRGDRDAWQDDIGNVMRVDADNPYYRWFVGTAG